jgi:hypothetical protein
MELAGTPGPATPAGRLNRRNSPCGSHRMLTVGLDHDVKIVGHNGDRIGVLRGDRSVGVNDGAGGLATQLPDCRRAGRLLELRQRWPHGPGGDGPRRWALLRRDTVIEPSRVGSAPPLDANRNRLLRQSRPSASVLVLRAGLSHQSEPPAHSPVNVICNALRGALVMPTYSTVQTIFRCQLCATS